MENNFHRFHELFQQLGLPASNHAIAAFIKEHSPLEATVKLPEAPFWTTSQATFLREGWLADSNWSGPIDQLNAILRQPTP